MARVAGVSLARTLLLGGATVVILHKSTNSFPVAPFVTRSHSLVFVDSYRERSCWSRSSSSSSLLHATKKKGKGKNESSSRKPQRQGFGLSLNSEKKRKGSGSVVAEISNIDDDFAAFPRLDPDVQKTLVPSPPVLFHEPGVLTDEVYDRLNQIYGFENFNRPLVVRDSNQQSATCSLQELITSIDSDVDDGFPLLKSIPESSVKQDSANDEPSTQNLVSLLNQMPAFDEFRVLHMDPLVLAIDDFLTGEECDRYVRMSTNGPSGTTLQSQSPTVGKDSSSRSQRTSTTWYHYYKNTPELMAKATKLVGFPTMHRWEEPQTVRYRRTEKFTWHLDALGPGENRPTKGGQRIATLLVYLTDLTAEEGGATMFRDLQSPEGERLAVVPKKGSALLFFPAAGGIENSPFDIRTLHCGQAVNVKATADKWIAQLWLCERDYTPTAPDAKNLHSLAFDAVSDYCGSRSDRI